MDNSGPPNKQERREKVRKQHAEEARLELAQRRIDACAALGFVVRAPAPRQPDLFGDLE